MTWNFGGMAVLYYPLGGSEVPPPPTGFFLLTDLSNFLLTDNTPLLTAGA